MTKNEDYYTGYYYGYKAALEWALKMKVCGWEEDGSVSTSNVICVSDIKRELQRLESEKK